MEVGSCQLPCGGDNLSFLVSFLIHHGFSNFAQRQTSQSRRRFFLILGTSNVSQPEPSVKTFLAGWEFHPGIQVVISLILSVAATVEWDELHSMDLLPVDCDSVQGDLPKHSHLGMVNNPHILR